MSDVNEAGSYSDDYLVNRMFDLVHDGLTHSDEFALIDHEIQARLLEAYPVEKPSTEAVHA